VSSPFPETGGFSETKFNLTWTLTGVLKTRVPPKEGTLKFCSTKIFFGASSSTTSFFDVRTLLVEKRRKGSTTLEVVRCLSRHLGDLLFVETIFVETLLVVDFNVETLFVVVDESDRIETALATIGRNFWRFNILWKQNQIKNLFIFFAFIKAQ
jgi:hypothetical protein